jgi:hypothetical protein
VKKMTLKRAEKEWQRAVYEHRSEQDEALAVRFKKGKGAAMGAVSQPGLRPCFVRRLALAALISERFANTAIGRECAAWLRFAIVNAHPGELVEFDRALEKSAA